MRRAEPIRAIAHPLWFFAALFMALNDHVFKLMPEPNLLTGKLSDVLGMIVAPWVLAVVLMLRSRRGIATAHIVVGFVFATINLFPSAALLWDGLTALGPFPWVTYVDPTDLIALPFLYVSWRVLLPVSEQALNVNKWLSRSAVVCGGLACMANDPPTDPVPIMPGFSGFEAEVGIANNTGVARIFRVRQLAPEVSYDCDVLLQDPSQAISTALFSPARSFSVAPGALLPLLEPTGDFGFSNPDCRAFLIDAAELSPRLVVWESLPTIFFANNPEFDDPSRVPSVRLGPEGRPEWDTHPMVFPAPRAGLSEQSCGIGNDESKLDFVNPVPVGMHTITATASSPDGCYGLELSEQVSRWYVCLGQADFPFKVGEQVEIGTGRDSFGFSEGFTITSTRAHLAAARSRELVFVDEGIEIAAATPSSDCPLTRDECGSLAVPVALTLNTGERILPEEQAAVGGGVLSILRATEFPIVHSRCQPETTAQGRVIESVFMKVEE